ncbi:putative Mg2+ transporter-C (MgtC) family protein [Pseudomonas sp. B10]|jgi:putative Mg2+ transporter-C (MgtC) family protein|uniref:MgtC/SapB family protein n=1 Tax=Pseudomonas TaxID=286 RepID=UPI00059EA450|nr:MULTISPECIES: MgtC/SapB family protein [Pseudomonas]AMT88947.1 methyltransferase [Pseudomonas koreensis]MBB4055024.1 putative Mg2+ transporter-C (MgtC) family protein [Pseudomonas koreensis]MBV4467579.1 MgtC/SapB family protein [Pseudomonas siliginis]TSB49216.1 MgtC/SapB family protein [Pseudomonas sp. ef1]SIR10223.1 putative Mg2+ transporter-C (MgtC) family protein [Pseudomonas sp. B10]
MEDWWDEVWATVQAEFADIGDASQMTRITVRLLMAAILGGILGFEREHKGKAAGVRTHMLVALGAALFVLVPQTSGAESDAMSRVLQGVIAGIGFLGAGTILKNQQGDESHVKGLTTAAGLWMTAAIGVAAGLGKEATALLSTILALAIFSVMPYVVRVFEKDVDKNDHL